MTDSCWQRYTAETCIKGPRLLDDRGFRPARRILGQFQAISSNLPTWEIENLVKMKPQILSRAVQLLPAILSLVNAAPARRDGTSNPGLRGSEALIGYSATEKVATGSKPDIKYSLLPGQKEDPDIGSYLDFENVENPQPIRGNTGSDDPGPRKLDKESPFQRGCLIHAS